MRRLVFSILGLSLVLVVSPSAWAQMPAPAYGGFGLNYVQPVPSGSYVLDRWWMVRATPTMGATMPPSAVVQQPVVMQPARSGRLSRATRTGRSLSWPARRVTAPTATPLPTGSLYWPAGVGTPLYSPAQRYASYGQGYGISPYGTVDYGSQYKGMYWGY